MTQMIYQLLAIITVLLTSTVTFTSSSSVPLDPPPLPPLPAASYPVLFHCPAACFCNILSRIVYCSRRNLLTIPSGISPRSLQLNLNGNIFQSSSIRSVNFTGLDGLVHLYMSECGIEDIDVDAFRNFTELKWLDLSNNKLRVIHEFTFRNLNLQHLFLNGNRNVRLSGRSFAGLVTTGLYLHDCALVEIDPAVVFPLNTTLRYLWLSGNSISVVDQRLQYLFNTLLHLRLGSNHLHCNCELMWLKGFYDKTGEIFKGAVPPSCRTPTRLKGVYFNEISLFDFRCQAPSFKDIDVTLGSSSARLKCSATADPAPTIYWVEPSGKTTKYASPPDENVRSNDGVLLATRDAGGGGDRPSGVPQGTYTCIACNEAGNVTLTINVSLAAQHRWTPERGVGRVSPVQKGGIQIKSSTSDSDRPNRRNSLDSFIVRPVVPLDNALYAHIDDVSDFRRHEDNAQQNWARVNYSNHEYRTITRHPELLSSTVSFAQKERGDSSPRLFTTLELTGAIVGTHVITLCLCLIVVSKCYRYRRSTMLARPIPITTTTTTTTSTTATATSAQMTLPAHPHRPSSYSMNSDKRTDKLSLSRDELRCINDNRTNYFTADYASIRSHIAARVS